MLGNKIKTLRKKAGLTQQELAKKIGVKTSTISMIEINNRKPSYEVLLNIAKCLNVSVDYLTESDNTYVANEKGGSGDILDIVDIIRLPVLKNISPDKPLFAVENHAGYYFADRHDLRDDGEYFYFRMPDDSMDLEFPPNTLLLIERTTSVDNGEIATLTVENTDGIVRKVFNKGNIYTLDPNSSNKKYTLDIVDANKVKIVGRIIMAIKKY